jgi:C1A family cysteine protease
MANIYGYLPDPTSGLDETGTPIDLIAKDYGFSDRLLPALGTAAVGEGDADLRPYCTESNQRSLSSCVGNATADAIEILNAIEEEKQAKAQGRDPKPPVQLSRLFVYTLARALMDANNDGQGDVDQDKGTHIRLAFEALSRWGICDEDIWPYDTAKVFTLPSIKAMRQAFGHKIHSYYRIKGVYDDRLAEIQAALRANHPVVFGTMIDKAFEALSGPNATAKKPTGATLGGHALIVVGYIASSNLYIVKNSWGQGWGDRGYCYMEPEMLAWEQTYDLWVPTFGSMF